MDDLESVSDDCACVLASLYSVQDNSFAFNVLRTAMSFLPLLRPFIMSELVRRSIYAIVNTIIPLVFHLFIPTYDWALGLAEALDGITASGVGDVDRRADLDVVGQRDVADLNSIIGPLVEQLGLANLSSDVLGQDLRASASLDDFGVRHLCGR